MALMGSMDFAGGPCGPLWMRLYARNMPISPISAIYAIHVPISDIQGWHDSCLHTIYGRLCLPLKNLKKPIFVYISST